MEKKEMYIIGVMSGTSLDGIDLAYVHLTNEDGFNFEIKKATTVPYSVEWCTKLANGFHLSGEELTKLDASYGIYLGKIIRQFIKENELEQVDLIASHGHTIFHNPKEEYTLQIGNGPYISSITGIKTICDFRVQDVALGGQGAPLVPIGDEFLFEQYNYCMNLGGFANISEQVNGARLAFDICPTNVVLNHYIKRVGRDYDNEGEFAATGTVDQDLLTALNKLEYYSEPAPKSLGYEFVVDQVFPMIDAFNLPLKDILRTLVEHMVVQISAVLDSNAEKTCLVTGGGVFNTFLMDCLKEKTNVQLVIPSNDLINYKEALIFALLGYLKNEGATNCLHSVTGAVKDHSSGVVFQP